MASLLSKLEKGEVPAEVANLRFASLLLDNPNVVYGDVQGHPHHFLVGLGVTSVKTGLGLDVSPAMAAHCKTAVQGMITWLELSHATGCVCTEPTYSGISWAAPPVENGESATEVTCGQALPRSLPSSFFDFEFPSSPS